MNTLDPAPSRARRRRLAAGLAAALLLLVHPAPAPAQDIPDTPAGRQAQALLAMLKETDEASIRTFLQERMGSPLQRVPVETHVQRFRQIREAAAGARVVGIDMRSPEQIAVVLKPAAGDPLRVTLEVNPQPPHRIEGFRVGPDEERPAIVFSSLDDLDRQLRRQAEEDRFSGVVLVNQAGRPVFHKAYGMADRAAGIPNRPDTRFNIGSLDKNFTAVAILQLAQEGRLGLDDPLGKHLEGFPAEIAERVTLRQLLQHRSGMGDYLNHPAFVADRSRFQEVAGYVALARTVPLEFEPGTRNRYSNLGYAVLGGVIEAVTGRPYHDVVKDRVFAPAGMTSTNSYGRRAGQENTAIGYTRRSGGDSLASNEATRPPRGSPAGGGYSNAEDLGRFVRALLGEQLLDSAHTGLFLNGFRPEAAGARSRGELALAGGAPGINASWTVNPETRQVVVVLANLDPPVASELAPAILRQVGGASGGGERGPEPAPPATLGADLRRQVLDSLAAVVERYYVTPDTARMITARLRERARAGAYDRLATPQELAAALTTDLRAVNGDKHLGVSAARQGGRSGPARPASGGSPDGIERVERLEGNVGYLKLGMVTESFDAMADALRKLDGTAAMILDLRGVPGGSGRMANFLISHFVAPGVHALNVFDPVQGDTVRRTTLAQVPGPRRTDVPLYVLVDGGSASAAEDVPFVLQNLGRATIVGEKTAGAGRPNGIFPIGAGLAASVSIMRTWDPRTGREWERVGVQPDLAVPSADALEAARRDALRRTASPARTRRTR
ncbi:MAG TPA: serine hydrolase [Longimicrobiaceae bacterium]|nr:serine hydrolase [Longimicrobiaceae bacterium]